ncbi:MAG: DUF4494 domain-containing protein [Odoribacteraceae bacterium]|jgi:hypothetical protein|nr:DUF4494 domain-containing protein [Odoribacteraceae bacterium]
MTANWFECRIKYVKTTEDGKEKKVSGQYLVDAVSYTEAESRIVAELSEMLQGEYHIAGLKRSNVSELVTSDDGNDDKWFKAKVAILDADQLTGKEKRTNNYFLVAGSSLERALENLKNNLSTYLVPCEIVSLSDSSVLDVFPYKVTIQEEI